MYSALDTIKKYGLIHKGDVIGCAVSGGSDSMALLHFLLSLREPMGFEVVCVNVDHGIRGKESEEDSDFVRRFCESEKVEFLFKKADAPVFAKERRIGLEQAAREIRYSFFYELIESGRCAKAFTAHNKMDNVETIMLNILRGSGMGGLKGMDVDNGRGIARPLLFTSKEEITRYVAENGIEYRIDSTNFDEGYSRNFLRNRVFPLLEQRFPGFYDNVERLSKIIRQEKEYLDALSQRHIEREEEGCRITLPCDEVLIRHAAFLCCRLLGEAKDIESANIEDVVELASGGSGSRIDIGSGITVHREYDSLFFERGQGNVESFFIPFKSGIMETPQYIIEAEEQTYEGQDIGGLKARSILVCDAGKVPQGAVIRPRREGDLFKRYKGGTKSLSDYLTDIKVPKRRRDSLPILAAGGRVLAVFPFDISDEIKVDDTTKRIFKIKIRRKTNEPL
ncbi:MAG: tRNA lysidine(34) synthetase TilS [Clostridiales bacterium]|jgi:tRNA(Ile)-lysidine synthase|nr:tRNA lysidine(34) synthetase TilS [Clostridiales bacterium]